MKTVIVDRKNCIGCTNCTQVCPKVFTMVDGKSMPDNEAFEPEKDENDVQMAIEQCPVQVISLQ